MIRKIFILFFVLMCTGLSAQEVVPRDTRDVDTVVFNQLSQELDYSKTKRKLRLREFEGINVEDKEEESSSVGSLLSGAGALIRMAGYVLIIGLILWLFYFLSQGVSKWDKKVIVHDVQLDQIEDIEEVDADHHYEEALRHGDYRMAIRMQYIKMLQILSQNKMIEWKPDKTNRDYQAEVRTTDLSQDFSTLTRSYEWIWYGNSTLDMHAFQPIDQLYNQFFQRLK